MDYITAAREFGPWLALVAMVVWSQRDKLVALFARRATVGIARDESDLRFDEEARKKVLQNGEYSRSLVEKFLEQLRTEQMERRSANKAVLEQARTTEHLATQAVSVMQDFADIARVQADRQDALLRDVTAALQATERTVAAVGFVLARVYFRDTDKTFDDLVEELDENRSDQGGGSVGKKS